MSGSAGQIIGGVIGAAIGFFAGGNVALGWAIGSAIGGAIDPQKIDGPHLQDRTVQVSSYGAAISVIYGGDLVTGNVIWSTDLIEHDVEQDGKGGPTVVSHTYSVSCAILIGEGPIAGIRKIMADAKVIYDVSDSADGQTQLASNILRDKFVFYQGTEDQMPDPTMEASLGVGNVPAYRGCAYIVFTDIPLENYGNRLPTFRFETSEEEADSPIGGVVYEPLTIQPWSGSRPEGGLMQFRDFSLVQSWSDYDTARVANAALQSGTGQYSDTFIGYSTSTNEIANVFPGGATVADDPQYVNYWMAVEVPDRIAPSNSGSLPYPDSITYCGPINHDWGATVDDGLIYWTGDASNYEFIASPIRIVKLVSFGTADTPQYQSASNCANYPPVAGHFPFVQGNAIIPLRAERMPTPPPDSSGCQPGDPCLLGSAQVPGNPDYCITCDGILSVRQSVTYEVITGTFKQLCAIGYRSGVLYQNALGPVHLPGDPEYDDAAYWTEQYNIALASGKIKSDVTHPVVVSQVARGTLASVDHAVADPANTTLDVIVADICVRSGMEAGTYDVTELEGIEVQGYALMRQMQARAAILPLQQAFWWDFIESGREIKAVRRGSASVATIPVDDLGATESSESQPAVIPNRGQEAELPATVTVAYSVRDNTYETGTQRARRTTTSSDQVMGVELAIVMTDQKASDIADVLMYSSWTNRTERTWSTTRKYADHEPSDVVTLDDGEFAYVVRITERSEEGGVIKWKGVDERPATYSPVTVPGQTNGGTSGVSYFGPMKLELIDCPPLTDATADAGMYAAAAGYMGSFPGGAAYESSDGGSTYTKVLTMKATATMGYAVNVLGDFTGGNTVDETNSVNVRMHSGTLSSVTRAQLLNEANAAILGDEIILFQRAELVATGIYKLTGLLRGRRGTEQHMATHAVNDRFVLFNPNSIYRTPSELSELNVERDWKAVTFGQTLDDASVIPFTNTGAGVKPLSPAHLVGIDIGGGQLLMRWVRRTRIGPSWRDGVDAPLGETSEQYEVLVNGTSVGTTSDSELEVTATSGDTITVYQLSSMVGRGFPASIEI